MITNWKDDFVKANGIRLHFWRTGGNKPPIVMLHGVTDNGLCWSPLAKELEHSYDLILLDVRGHGFSDKPGTGYTNNARADDINGLIYSLKLGRPALIGHSMGAQIAAYTAQRHPKRISCLVLEDPPWFPGRKMSSQERAELAMVERNEILAYRQQTIDEITAQKRLTDPKWGASEFPAWSESKQQVDPDYNKAVFQKMIPIPELVKQIHCPGLLITGDPELGAIVTPQLSQQVSEINPAIQVAHIPNTGHNIRREDFPTFLKVVKDFLKIQYPSE